MGPSSREFAPVVPLVFGWQGEINAEFDALLSEVAEIGASVTGEPFGERLHARTKSTRGLTC